MNKELGRENWRFSVTENSSGESSNHKITRWICIQVFQGEITTLCWSRIVKGQGKEPGKKQGKKTGWVGVSGFTCNTARLDHISNLCGGFKNTLETANKCSDISRCVSDTLWVKGHYGCGRGERGVCWLTCRDMFGDEVTHSLRGNERLPPRKRYISARSWYF